MRKLMLAFAAIGLITTAVFVVFRSFGGGGEINTSRDQSMETSDSRLTATETMDSSSATGSYVEYSESKLAATDGTKIIFFHASWCPQCRALEADIKKQGVPKGTTIFKVDYDSAQDLRKKYGVTLQTTVVKVDEKGNLISKFTPYQKPTLQNTLDNL